MDLLILATGQYKHKASIVSNELLAYCHYKQIYEEHMTQDTPSRYLDKIVIRVPDGLRDRIAETAKENNRSVNAELVSLLMKQYPEPPDLKEMLQNIDTILSALTSNLAFKNSDKSESYTLSSISNELKRLKDFLEKTGQNNPA